MKKFKNIEEFEDLLKDQLSGHQVSAPADAWAGIASSTGASTGVASQVISYFSSFSNILKVALFAGGISAAGIVLYLDNAETTSPAVEDQPKQEQVDKNDLAIEENAETVLTDEPTSISSSDRIDAENSTGSTSPNSTTPNTDYVSTPQSPLNNEQSVVVEEGQIETPEGSGIVNQITVSNPRPCKGDAVKFTSTLRNSGEWSIDGKMTKLNSSSFTHAFDKEGSYAITFSEGTTVLTYNLLVTSLDAQIVESKKGDDAYGFSLNNKAIIANWYIDNKLVSTNARSIEFNQAAVGRHDIKAVPVNHSCNAAINHQLEVNAMGSIQWFDIFTPDGDGKNDEYRIIISNYENFSIQIFNSSNVKVFASQDPNVNWNGREFNSGRECAEGEYVAKVSYQLKGESPQQKNVRLILRRE